MTNTAASMPYDWLKQIPTALLQLDEIPLIGSPLPFPWEELSKGMGEVFQIPDFKIEPSPMQWKTQEELFTGMGDQLKPLVCAIPSLEGKLYWLMADEDVYRLMSLLLNESPHEHDVLEDEFLQGFYQFVAYEAIHIITKLPFGSALSPQIQKEDSLPHEAALCLDVKIHLREKVLVGRLIITQDLRRTWKEKHAERSLELPIHSSLSEKLTILVNVEAGRTALKASDWKKVQPGDFIFLDSCTINPDEKGGRVTLSVNGMPFYIGKIKDGNIKVLDHPLYHQEETTAMSKYTPEDQSEEHDDSSLDFDSESELDSEIESEHESEEESALESNHELEEISQEESSTIEGESVSELEESGEKGASLEETVAEEAVVPEEKHLNIDEIPLSIVVEVGRLQMSVKKMLELQPGNLLELDIHPENGVDLVVNGKRIAKGELIRLGEALGVRILDIN